MERKREEGVGEGMKRLGGHGAEGTGGKAGCELKRSEVRRWDESDLVGVSGREKGWE